MNLRPINYKIYSVKRIQNGWIMNSQVGDDLSPERFASTKELIEILQDQRH